MDESQDAEPEWFAGSKNGEAGWFPANYVKKLTKEGFKKIDFLLISKNPFKSAGHLFMSSLFFSTKYFHISILNIQIFNFNILTAANQQQPPPSTSTSSQNL